MKRLLLLATASILAVSCAASAETRTLLTSKDLAAAQTKYELVKNDAFLRPADAAAAVEPFNGTVSLSETTMLTEPATFKSSEVLGKNPQIFPAVSLSFITVGDDLVPVTQDVIRNGSLPGGTSYWDIIVQPGKVWSETTDDGWSRASFPFSLMQSIEGETHNGVMTFLYKGDQVSNLRFQIVTQTSPFYVEDYFTASGTLAAKFDPGTPVDAGEIKARFEASEKANEVLHPWTDLEKEFGADKLVGFDSKIRPNEIVLDGIGIGDKFYLKSCPTPVGELPYCDRQRFGVWSMTKSIGNAAAFLRLAEKYGKDIYTAKLVDYITEARDIPGWENVTFGNALSMATGMGYGSTDPENGVGEPFDANYYGWYEAPTMRAKLDALLKVAKPYPWGPGKLPRYRDEDMFLLGVAMTRYLQSKEGPDANIWEFVRAEVYEPLGILEAPMNRTIETDGSKGQPLMAYGFYPRIGDIIKLATLFQNGGKYDGKQLLNAELLADLKASKDVVGLDTKIPARPRYYKAFWRASAGDCEISYPMMTGWGQNLVMLLPNDVTIYRLAKNWDGDEGSADTANMTDVAGKLKPTCE